VLVSNDNQTSVLEARVTFMLPCDNPQSIISPDTTGNSTVIGFQDPFYASISPQVFALATATVISYILLILIFITPRTFYVGGPGGGAGFLSRRGMISGSYGSSSVIGVGRRPLLQKIATLTVTVSLTIATADTFRVAQSQYDQGYMDSSQLVDEVVGSLEIRIVRVISDTFLWLAQVQTLIRLFPRHKEKVTIKWLGFALVSLDTIFSILNSFVSENTRTSRPRSFQDAIPALNYLFELAISLIYASCVVYYSLSKRRYAFWHPKMRNVCLVALLSLIAVLIPVVFFVLDISQPNVAGWGEYIRWVGAAAASVVVWEWVERIESLERDERKDGILGREVFDGDEMLNMTPSEDASWAGRDRGVASNDFAPKGTADGVVSRFRRLRARLPRGNKTRGSPGDGISTGADATKTNPPKPPPATRLAVPPPAVTPPSRSDSASAASAASTVYAIRYHNLTSPSPPILEEVDANNMSQADAVIMQKEVFSDRSTSDSTSSDIVKEVPEQQTSHSKSRPVWQAVANPFKRRRAEPPAEVADAQHANGIRRSPADRNLNLKARLSAFTSAQKGRFGTPAGIPTPALPVMLIPAPRPNGRTWSPDDLHGVAEEMGEMEGPTTDDQITGRGGEGGSQDQGHEASDVVFIPAPTDGRTRPPGDELESGHDHFLQHPAAPGHQRTASTGTRSSDCPSRAGTSCPTPVMAPGTLTTSDAENQPPRLPQSNPTVSSRRSTYPPRGTISPISERDADDTDTTQTQYSLPISSDHRSDPGAPPAPSSQTLSTIVPPADAAQADDELASASTSASERGAGEGDGRNTGGTPHRGV